MKYFGFNNIKIPLTCITGFSYSRNANIVPINNLTCKCTGITPISVQVQMQLNAANCMDTDFITLARQLFELKPNKVDKPSFIVIGDDIAIPQMKFMLISTNVTTQSDRLGNLQEVNVNWTLNGSQVVKDENRNIELRQSGVVKELLLPKTVLHCKDKEIECINDISISELKLSGFFGTIQIVLSDTYKKVDRDTWLTAVNDSSDTYFEIENYGKYYISKSSIEDNWLTFELTKFDRSWYQQKTETFMNPDDKLFGLKDIFKDADVMSKAKFEYLKYDDTPINCMYSLQDSLGYLVGLRKDKIFLYDTPDIIAKGNVVYDFVLDEDTMTRPYTKVIIRDGYGEYKAGNDDGETFFVNALCRVTPDTAENVLKYVRFNQNMITLTIPLEKRINIGSIIGVNVGDNKILNCVCTEFDIDFLENSMQLELHYINRE